MPCRWARACSISTCFVLARAGFGREDRAAVRVLEVAVGEAVARLRLLATFFVDAEMPFRVLAPAVFLDEPVLVFGRRLVLAPVVAIAVPADANGGWGEQREGWLRRSAYSGSSWSSTSRNSPGVTASRSVAKRLGCAHAPRLA
jgi:hypothetical protein